MSDILNRLPENTLTRSLRAITQDAAAFKSRQRTTGASGQLGYYPASALDWDLVASFPTVPPMSGAYAEYRLIFTGDGSQKFPIVLPQCDVRVNGTSDANKVRMGTNGRYEYFSGSETVQIYTFAEPDPIYFEDDYKLAWLIGLQYSGTVTLRIKARGTSSCDGTWSLVRLP